MTVQALIDCKNSRRYLRTTMLMSGRQSLDQGEWVEECRRVADALHIPIEGHRGLYARQYAVMELERPLAEVASWVRLLGERCLVWVNDLAVPDRDEWTGEVLVILYQFRHHSVGTCIQTMHYDAVISALELERTDEETPAVLLDKWWDDRLADLTSLRRM